MKKLSDINIEMLKQVMKENIDYLPARYGKWLQKYDKVLMGYYVDY